jgi:2-dehydropantoate 2-reductase
MKDNKTAIIGIGATGTVLAAALLKQDPETICVDPMPGLGDILKKEGITITGVLDYHVKVHNFLPAIKNLKDHSPDLIFISTKTYHLAGVLEEIRKIITPGTKIISTHNGLGPEDTIAEELSIDSVLRMSLNFGASIKSPGKTEMIFFNKPNHLGSLAEKERETGIKIAALLTESGLDTEFVDDIKFHVWRKMIYKCTMASICAITDRTIKEVMDFPPTREIAEGCINEALAVAKATGYDMGKDFIKGTPEFISRVGAHKDSMCFDVANKLPTEIDYLGGKIVEYAHEKNIPVPYFTSMSNIVKAIEDTYMREKIN